MRRDLDLIRHLLLKLEGEQSYKDTKESAADARFADKYEDYEGAVNEHYLWLFDAGFIEAKLIARADGYRAVCPRRLTWAGAEYYKKNKSVKVLFFPNPHFVKFFFSLFYKFIWFNF